MSPGLYKREGIKGGREQERRCMLMYGDIFQAGSLGQEVVEELCLLLSNESLSEDKNNVISFYFIVDEELLL